MVTGPSAPSCARGCRRRVPARTAHRSRPPGPRRGTAHRTGHGAHGLGLLQSGGEGVDPKSASTASLVTSSTWRAVPPTAPLPVEVEAQVARPVQRAGLNGVGPRCRSAACTIWVPGGLGGAAAPVRVDGGDHGVTLDELAGLDVHPVHQSVLAIFCTSVTAAFPTRPRRFPEIGPMSAIWPPRTRRTAGAVDTISTRSGGRRRRPRRAPVSVAHHRNALAVDEDAEMRACGG